MKVNTLIERLSEFVEKNPEIGEVEFGIVQEDWLDEFAPLTYMACISDNPKATKLELFTDSQGDSYITFFEI